MLWWKSSKWSSSWVETVTKQEINVLQNPMSRMYIHDQTLLVMSRCHREWVCCGGNHPKS